MTLYKEVLPSQSFKLLQTLMNKEILHDFYLVGGTALALQIGHRKSIDLDLFSQKEFRNNLIEKLPVHEQAQILLRNDNAIEFVLNKTKISMMYFGFSLYKKIIEIDNLRLASPTDIGLMKLLALQGRSTKKDIIDLYFINREVILLDKLLDIFETHYPKESFNSYSSIKSLIDREFLANEPVPLMLKECNWKECLSSVENALLKHIKSAIY